MKPYCHCIQKYRKNKYYCPKTVRSEYHQLKILYSRRRKMVLVAASLSYTDLVDGIMDRERTQVFRIYRTVSFRIWPPFVNLIIHKDHEISKA